VNNNRIAFVCAMPIEVVPLVEKLALEKIEIDGIQESYEGTLDGCNVVAIVTGMGIDYATDGITRLLDAMPVSRVVVVGITGALENDTPIGTLVMPEAIVHSRTGVEYAHTPSGNVSLHGKMWTADGLTTNLDRLAELRAANVVSVDMETAALAHVCNERGVPWAVYRAISDRATDGSVTEEVFRLSNMDGTPNHEAIKAYFDEHPERMEQLAKMGEDCKLATNVAADAAIAACRAL
jgi:adenosylhomocysteine nucleosidase